MSIFCSYWRIFRIFFWWIIFIPVPIPWHWQAFTALVLPTLCTRNKTTIYGHKHVPLDVCNAREIISFFSPKVKQKDRWCSRMTSGTHLPRDLELQQNWPQILFWRELRKEHAESENCVILISHHNINITIFECAY